MKILVTGGAGFIGSAVVRLAVSRGYQVVNVDALTYAACLANVAQVTNSPNYAFEQADIRDRAALDRVFAAHDPDIVMHLAAESHVDRSIDGPGAFIETNITGTFTLLQAARAHHERRPDLRFHHISTDEVYGSLGEDGLFTETIAYDPRSPYSASKAATIGFTRAVAKELAPRRIRVNAIAPGFIADTPFHNTFTPDETQSAIAAKTPLQRGGRPDEVAEAAVFLAADGSSFITGETLGVNGGLYFA